MTDDVKMSDWEDAEYADKIITCSNCGQEFLWLRHEQLFFKERHFAPPKRCLVCRRARRFHTVALNSERKEEN